VSDQLHADTVNYEIEGWIDPSTSLGMVANRKSQTLEGN